MLTVGLTGGIGSGKTAVASRLAALGAVIVDFDVLARAALAPGSPGRADVIATFGPAVLGPDGDLDRAALARVIFADARARETLNGIVHPRVAAAAAELTAAAPADAIVVHEVPLLVEAGWADRYDVVVVVTAAEGVAVERLVRHRGMRREDARERANAQVTDKERLKVADYVVRNSGDEDLLNIEVQRLWAALVRKSKLAT